MNEALPNVEPQLLDVPTLEKLGAARMSAHRPRILLLYGSNRERSFSRLLVQEAARLLETFGARRESSTPPSCRCPTRCRTTTRRCASYGN